jgi:hypothetical protein
MDSDLGGLGSSYNNLPRGSLWRIGSDAVFCVVSLWVAGWSLFDLRDGRVILASQNAGWGIAFVCLAVVFAGDLVINLHERRGNAQLDRLEQLRVLSAQPPPVGQLGDPRAWPPGSPGNTPAPGDWPPVAEETANPWAPDQRLVPRPRAPAEGAADNLPPPLWQPRPRWPDQQRGTGPGSSPAPGATPPDPDWETPYETDWHGP